MGSHTQPARVLPEPTPPTKALNRFFEAQNSIWGSVPPCRSVTCRFDCGELL
jgi:hypothetical protein